MKICVISFDDTYGNVCGLAAALSRVHGNEVTCVLGKRSRKKLYKQFPGHKVGFWRVPKNSNVYILVGAITIQKIGWDFNRPTVLILTDSSYLKNVDGINRLSMEAIATYAMPDLIEYRRNLPTRVFYQPFDIHIPIKKDEELLICHSPFHKRKMEQKGTPVIKKVLDELGVNHEIIMGKSWQETLEIKSRAHIFIDQIRTNGITHSGVGKSGLEAMLLGCMVMSEAYLPRTDIPGPPVSRTSEVSLKDDIRFFMYRREVVNAVARNQSIWAYENLSYEAVSKRIMEVL